MIQAVLLKWLHSNTVKSYGSCKCVCVRAGNTHTDMCIEFILSLLVT